MRDAPGPAPAGEAGRVKIDKEAADCLLAARFTGRGAQDHEIGDIGMADEMLGPVDDEIIPIPARECAHRADVGACIGFGHGKAIVALAADCREEVLHDLTALASAQDVARPRDHHLQAIAGAAKLALHQRGIERAEPAAAEFGRHVDGIEAELLGLAPDVFRDIGGHVVRVFDQFLVRVEFGLDEAPDRFDQHLLFGGKFEMHHFLSRLIPIARPTCAGRSSPAWAASTA